MLLINPVGKIYLILKEEILSFKFSIMRRCHESADGETVEGCAKVGEGTSLRGEEICVDLG